MAFAEEIHKGVAVRWFVFFHGWHEGVVIRVDKLGMWADVRYSHEPTVFPDVTYRTRRMRVTLLHVVQPSGGESSAR